MKVEAYLAVEIVCFGWKAPSEKLNRRLAQEKSRSRLPTPDGGAAISLPISRGWSLRPKIS